MSRKDQQLDANRKAIVEELKNRFAAREVADAEGFGGLTVLTVNTPAGELRLSVYGDNLFGRFSDDRAAFLHLRDYNPHSGKYNLQGWSEVAVTTPPLFVKAAVAHVKAAVEGKLRDRNVEVRVGAWPAGADKANPLRFPVRYRGSAQALFAVGILGESTDDDPAALNAEVQRLLRHLFMGGQPYRYEVLEGICYHVAFV